MKPLLQHPHPPMADSVPRIHQLHRGLVITRPRSMWAIIAVAMLLRSILPPPAAGSPLFPALFPPSPPPLPPRSVAIGDLNADGKPDLAVANYASDGVSVLLGYGNGSFGPQTEYPVGSWPLSVAMGDLNADGRPDLALPISRGSTVAVLPGYGGGYF